MSICYKKVTTNKSLQKIFLKAFLFCFKSQNENKKDLENELYDAFDKVQKDSPNNWLKTFGVIEI